MRQKFLEFEYDFKNFMRKRSFGLFGVPLQSHAPERKKEKKRREEKKGKIPQLVVSIFSFIRTSLCFLGSPSSAAPEKKGKKRKKKKVCD